MERNQTGTEASDPQSVKKDSERTGVKLHDRIIAQIQLLIHNGRLKHGSQLPPERELAKIFKVSRHALREALRILEEKKILKTKIGSGTYVNFEDEAFAVNILAQAIHREKNTLSEIFQFRALLEPQIAKLAAEHATSEDIRALGTILDQQEHHLENVAESKVLDEQFHLALCRATGNAVLFQVIEILNQIVQKSREDHAQDIQRNRLSLEGHRHIFEAIQKSDAKSAQELMAAHLHEIQELVV